MFVYRMHVSCRKVGHPHVESTGGKSVHHLRVGMFLVWLYVAVSHPGFSSDAKAVSPLFLSGFLEEWLPGGSVFSFGVLYRILKVESLRQRELPSPTENTAPQTPRQLVPPLMR